MPLVLDLCGGSGSWSKPYAEAGYTVRVLDLPEDVRLLRHQYRPGEVRGILAAPPCTVFSRAGGWVHRTEDEIKLALSVVDACLRAVTIYRPDWWALENPKGTLSKFLGPPALSFDPCDFGDPWTKRTYLWGSFTPPAPNPIPPAGTLTSLPGMKNAKTRAARAVTPPGFARAFFTANP